MIAAAALFLLVLALAVADIRRTGAWDPWAEFDETEGA